MAASFYSAPSIMSGGFTVYGGYRRQRGGGLFGSFRKFMAPMGRQALSGIKSLARNKTVRDLAKKAAEKSAEVLAGVAVDALQGRNIGEAIKERGRQAALNTIMGGPETSNPPRKRKAAKSKGKRGQKLKQRKRLGSAKVVLQGPPRKKRRRALSQAASNRNSLF